MDGYRADDIDASGAAAALYFTWLQAARSPRIGRSPVERCYDA